MITPSEVKEKSASGDSIVIPSPLLVVSVAVAITSVIIINNIIPTIIITGHSKAWLFYLLGPRSWPTREGAQPCAESGCTAVTV